MNRFFGLLVFKFNRFDCTFLSSFIIEISLRVNESRLRLLLLDGFLLEHGVIVRFCVIGADYIHTLLT